MKLSIVLDDTKRIFYSTRESVRGYVKMKCEEDIVIEELSISLEGKAVVRVEKHPFLSNEAGYLNGDQLFLRVVHCPTIESKDRRMRKHEGCTFPFDLMVPDNIPEDACSHNTSSTLVRDQHLFCPPSLASFAANGIYLDDLGPKQAKIAYGICARLVASIGNTAPLLLEKTHRIRLMPQRAEKPPLTRNPPSAYCQLSQEHNVYRGLPLVNKLVGRLSVRTFEQTALQVADPHDTAESVLALRTPVDLRFDPANEHESPPHLDVLCVKLHSFTFSGASPFQTIPEPGHHHDTIAEQYQHVSTTRLGSCNLRAVRWTQQKLDVEIPSGTDCDSTRTSQDSCRGLLAGSLPFYTANLQIPITVLPRGHNRSRQRLFPPTFSSCLISRSYSLELEFSYKYAPSTTSATSASISQKLTPRSHVILKAPLHMMFQASVPVLTDNLLRESADHAPADFSQSKPEKAAGDLSQDFATQT